MGVEILIWHLPADSRPGSIPSATHSYRERPWRLRAPLTWPRVHPPAGCHPRRRVVGPRPGPATITHPHTLSCNAARQHKGVQGAHLSKAASDTGITSVILTGTTPGTLDLVCPSDLEHYRGDSIMDMRRLTGGVQ